MASTSRFPARLFLAALDSTSLRCGTMPLDLPSSAACSLSSHTRACICCLWRLGEMDLSHICSRECVYHRWLGVSLWFCDIGRTVELEVVHGHHTRQTGMHRPCSVQKIEHRIGLNGMSGGFTMQVGLIGLSQGYRAAGSGMCIIYRRCLFSCFTESQWIIPFVSICSIQPCFPGAFVTRGAMMGQRTWS